MSKIKGVLVAMLIIASCLVITQKTGYALDQPFPVYGTIRNADGTVLPVGITVIAKDLSRSTQISVITSSGGYYQVELSSLPECQNGDIIEIYCSYNNEDNSQTFTLDVSQTSKEISFSLVGNPQISTNQASDITSDSVTLHGSLSALKDSSCTLWFEYGKTTSYGQSTPLVIKYNPTAFSALVTGLEPDTIYHVRMVAQNSRKITYGSDVSFHTSTEPPSVATNAASNIGYASATLNGYLSEPGATNCEVWFVYDTVSRTNVDDYSLSTSKTIKTSASSFSRTVSGFSVDTTYYFRAVADNVNESGPIAGTERSFTTHITKGSVITLDAINVTSVGATLQGQLIDLGGDTSCYVWFEYGETTAYGYATNNLSRSTSGLFSLTTNDLLPGTLYHFRAVVKNSKGIYYDIDHTFSTLTEQAIIETEAVEYAIILMANVTSLGGASNCTSWFEYWEAGNHQNATKTISRSIYQPGKISDVITGMSENTTYYYRAVVENSQGITFGANLSFKMVSLPLAPSVTTNTAIPKNNSAVLSGTLNTLGDSSASYVWFEYWNTTRFSTPPDVMNETGVFTAEVHNLIEGAEYEYRAIAVGENGRISYGEVQTFETNISANQPPDVTLISPENSSINAPSLSLMAAVSDADNDTLYVTFYWGNGTIINSIANLQNGVVSIALTLSYNTTYEWYVRVSDGFLEKTSEKRVFTTSEQTLAVFNHSFAFHHEPVMFFDESQGYVEEWLWHFGDGNISYEMNPVHTYSKPGTYHVNLTIVDTYSVNSSITVDVQVWERGDATMDGIINALDITRIKRVVEGLDSISTYPPSDVDNNGVVNAADVTAVINKILGLP